MRNLNHPDLGRFRVTHPFGQIPDSQLPYAGAFVIPFRAKPRGYVVEKVAHLRVIASRGGDPHPDAVGAPGWDWDHVSVSLYDRTPTWEQMCFIKNLFFGPDEDVMQLHPARSYINNHPHCLHLWRPLSVDIPLPPSILVGLEELNIKE